MSIATTIRQPCARCGEPVEAVLHKSFVIEDDASLRTIIENRFHALDCARCGERRAFEADFLVTNRARDMFVQVIGRDEEVPSTLKTMRSLVGMNVFARVVPGRDDLVEKVKLRTLGLDDVAVEVMKHFVRIQLHDLEGKTTRRFDRVEGESFEFLVWQPGHAVHRIGLPAEVYRNAQRDLGTQAWVRELEVDERLARRLLNDRSKEPRTPPVPVPSTLSRQTIKVTHAGVDRRGRRFVSDGSILLLDTLVMGRDEAPVLLTTETVEGLVGRTSSCWTPVVELTRSKLHGGTYRTSDDVALGEMYVKLLLGLGRPLHLGTTERLGPVLIREGDDVVGTLMPLNLPPETAATPSMATEEAGEAMREPCPVCRRLIPRGESFCEACGVGLAWRTDQGATPIHPELSPGRLVVSESFESRPFPGRTALEENAPGVMEARPVPGGKGATYYAAVTDCYVDYARPLRDACVRATFTPLDPGIRLGLCARHSVLGGIQVYCLFDMIPLAGRAWLARGVQSSKLASSSRLASEVSFDAIAPGEAIELELRVAGPTLHAFINGRPVLAAHDPSLGAGSFGIRVGKEHDVHHPVRVLCHGYEVREVLP